MEKKITSSFKGLNTDANIGTQPEGTYRFSLNGTNESHEGDYSFKSIENSNELCSEAIPQSYHLLGSVYMRDNQIAVFIVSDDGNDSQIGIVDEFCKYTMHVSAPCLSFSKFNQIDSIYRLRRDCEDVIYYTDGVNPVRYFNFTRPELFYTDAYKEAVENNTQDSFVGQQWSCNKMKIFPGYSVPCFSDARVFTGGSLRSGSYQFAIQYLDFDLNPTNWAYVSQPVKVWRSEETLTYREIEGSSNENVDPIGGSIETSKAIEITISNLDQNFPYYRIAVIESTNFDGRVSAVYASSNIPISEDIYIYTGALDGYTDITLDEVLIDTLQIDSAQHIEQLENRLILANIRGKRINFCGFQKFASKISTKYTVKEIPIKDQSVIGDPKSPLTGWESLGYMGDEVYAAGIVYVFDDGTVTPAFHIPGRPAEDSDTQIINTWSRDLEHIEDDETQYNSSPNIPTWKAYNTADPSTNKMAYWESDLGTYRNRDDCGAGDYWGEDSEGNSLTGTAIRHHRFPSRNLEPHYNLDDTALKIKICVEVTITLTAVASSGYNIDGDFLFQNSVTNFQNQITIDAGDPAGEYSFIVWCTSEAQETENLSANDFGLNIEDGDVNFTGSGTTAGEVTINSIIAKVQTPRENENKGVIRVLGFEFSNIEYPHPDIVGHYFVRAKRDNNNRTVLDAGFSHALRQKQTDSGKYITYSYPYELDDPAITSQEGFMALHTPRFAANQETLNATYVTKPIFFKINRFVTSGLYVDGVNTWLKEVDTKIEVGSAYYGQPINTTTALQYGTYEPTKNYNLTKQVILNGVSFDDSYEADHRTYNLSHNNRVHIAQHTRTPANGDGPIILDNFGNYYTVLKKLSGNLHSDLDNIEYHRTHNCTKIATSLTDTFDTFGGDTYIFELEYKNTLFREFRKTAWKTALSIVAIIAATVATIYTAGAASGALAAALGSVGVAASAAGISTAIVTAAIVAGAIGVTAQSVKFVIEQYQDSNLDEMAASLFMSSAVPNKDAFTGARMSWANTHISNIFVESEVNLELKQSQNHECGDLYNSGQESIAEYFRRQIMYFDEGEEKWITKGVMCPELYYVNKDLIKLNTENVYFPLPDTYNCCSECLETHELRIHYSEQSFQEELTDHYRIFKPQNYRDIEGQYGRITNLFRKGSNLYAHASEKLWQIPKNYQERITGEIISFIGTGEFFSIPPIPVGDTKTGNSGSQHKWATVKTPYGVFFANAAEGRVFILSDGLDELSSLKYGMRNWFKENLPITFDKQFLQVAAFPYPNSGNIANRDGTGLHAVYDTRKERVLLTKKDYELLPEWTDKLTFGDYNNASGLPSGLLYFDINRQFHFEMFKGSARIVHTDNPQFFKNKSWTLAYSFLASENPWTDFYSFIPELYLSSPELLLSYKESKGLWRHHVKGSYRTFYGITYPFIVETVLIQNPTQTVQSLNLLFQTVARQYLNEKDSLDVRDITFNEVVLYNSRQSSGLLQMDYKADGDPNMMLNSIQDTDTTQISLERREKDWMINDYRDYIINYNTSIFSTEWEDISSQYFIDKVVNPDSISLIKDWTEQEIFRDKYLVVRLIFNTFENTVNLIYKYISDVNQSSIR